MTPFFSPDGSRIWYTSLLDNRSVWSVGSAGGEPRKELGNLGGFVVMDGVEMARDGKSLVVTVLNEGVTTLRISSPPGSPLRPFPGAPSLNATFSRVRLRFTHDGRKLLSVFGGPRFPEECGLWVMSWPPGTGAARKIQTGPLMGGVINSADWMLDDRHIVVDTAPTVGFFGGGSLLLLDSESGSVWPLTSDNAGAAMPSVGPDGRILYLRQVAPYDLIEIPLDGPPRRELLATDWNESFGAWSRAANEFVYASDQGGQSAIWISSADGAWKRKAVSAKDIGVSDDLSLRSPEFSPDGKRIAYIGGRRVWVSPTSGGRPVPISPDDQTVATPTWSADGKWIAYRVGESLMKFQVGGSMPASKISATTAVPIAWSPDGKWITVGLEGGIGVVSPDGSHNRLLVKRPFQPFSALGWGRDGAMLYLMESDVDQPLRLFAIDVATGVERLIHEYPPDGRRYTELFLNTARLYPSRDGKSLLSSRWSVRSSIWMLEGVEPPRSFWRRLLR